MAVQVLEQVMGRKPYFVRIGGTIPAAALIKSILGIDITMFAFGWASEVFAGGTPGVPFWPLVQPQRPLL